MNRTLNHPFVISVISAVLAWVITKHLDSLPNNWATTALIGLVLIAFVAISILAAVRLIQQLWMGWTWTGWRWRSPIVWTFGTFMGWAGGGGQLGFICFQAKGKNRSRRGFSNIRGYLVSNMDNSTSEAMYFAIDGVRVSPQDTSGIPPGAEFDIGIPLGKNVEDRLDEYEVKQRWASFRFVLELDGVRYEREFSEAQVIQQIEEARKLVSPVPVARVQRRNQV